MKKSFYFLFVLVLLVCMIGFIGCSDPTGGETTEVTFSGVTQTGGTSVTVTTTGLILTFSVDPTTLAASNITVTGATKGTLTGTGTTRSLAISDITVANGETVSVTVTSPAGFAITGSPQTAVVYKAPSVGDAYQGGVIAYILQSGDPGYSATVPHGIIAATDDQSAAIMWAIEAYWAIAVTGTLTTLGSGAANTALIVTQNGAESTYAAGLCAVYSNADTGTGVYSDWYLPSQDELNKLYLNKVAVGGFAGSFYWSSSEGGADAAWLQWFDDSTQDYGFKNKTGGVRAVRAF